MRVIIGDAVFSARFEDGAPRSVAAFRALAGEATRLVHARWSGKACWVPLGVRDLNLPAENVLSEPAPGQVLLYPGGVSETEILLPYGPTRFACVAGPLSGNHVLTIEGDLERLAAMGRRVLRDGAQPVRFEG